ncbi:MAG TPA: hypothetical protein PKX93_02225, partial [bacterium]|nr:hypothetical protein [bacterium]
MDEKVTAGFVGFGEVNSPRDLIESKCEQAVRIVESLGITVKKTAPVADDPEGKQSSRAITELKKFDFDFLIACVAGWIPSWAVVQTLVPFKERPVLLWGTSGDNLQGRLVTTAAQAGTTALRKVLKEMKFRFKFVVNRLDLPAPAGEILSFARACRAVKGLKGATIGLAGYRDMRLYGTGYDPVSLKEKFGLEVEHFDLLELYQLMDKVTEKQVKPWLEYLEKNWVFTKKPQQKTIKQTIKLFLAFKRKVEERNYAGLSYSDVDGIKKLMGFAPAGALTLLHDTMTLCTIPENDTPGLLTQLAAWHLTGQLPAYLEFYEFTEKGALMGVPDYVPGAVVEGKIKVMPTSFGQFGEGLLNVSRLKTGRVTLVRLDRTENDYSLHLITGTAKTA